MGYAQKVRLKILESMLDGLAADQEISRFLVFLEDQGVMYPPMIQQIADECYVDVLRAVTETGGVLFHTHSDDGDYLIKGSWGGEVKELKEMLDFERLLAISEESI